MAENEKRETTSVEVVSGAGEPAVGDIMERGERRCVECGQRHNYIVTEVRENRIRRASWADPTDGHYYKQESRAVTIDRLRSAITEAVAVLGPEPATCCEGCAVEMGEALRVLRAAIEPASATSELGSLPASSSSRVSRPAEGER